jgi:hypothetical protein
MLAKGIFDKMQLGIARPKNGPARAYPTENEEDSFQKAQK